MCILIYFADNSKKRKKRKEKKKEWHRCRVCSTRSIPLFSRSVEKVTHVQLLMEISKHLLRISSCYIKHSEISINSVVRFDYRDHIGQV